MSDNYEPIIVKARALAAVADPANGASHGEQNNAAQALKRLLERHGLNLGDISEEHKAKHQLECIVSNREKITLATSERLLRLAAQIARYVSGRNTITIWKFKSAYYISQRGLKPDLEVRCWVAEAELTRGEAADWKECFMHYARLFVKMQLSLDDAVKQAKKAQKLGLCAFANKFDLFPPDASTSPGKLDLARLAAQMAAMNHVKGDRWQKKAGSLEGQLMLG